MITTMRSTFLVSACLILSSFLLLPLLSESADPDPLQDICVRDLNSTQSINGFPCKPASKVTSDDFFFDGFLKEGNTSATAFGAAVTPGNVLAFPGLNTQGISMNRVDFAEGGINPPHSHPRASETGVVIRGKLLVGFITADNVYYSKVLSVGQMFVVPRGLVHFQMNVGKGKALAFTAFNSQNPGAIVASLNLFATNPSIPNAVLEKAFQAEEDLIKSLKSKFSS